MSFPDNTAAEKRIELQRRHHGISCFICGAARYAVIKSRKLMPRRCNDCREHFSVRKATVTQPGKLGYETQEQAGISDHAPDSDSRKGRSDRQGNLRFRKAP